jgi:hypothetical protein
MVLRRKRILYRRSRYGDNPIRTKEIVKQPKIRPPSTRAQNSTILPPPVEDLQRQENHPQPAATEAQSAVPSATTLQPDAYQKVPAPSVISATKTTALTSHEELAFPPPPIGHIRRRFKTLKRQRQKEKEDQLARIRMNLARMATYDLPRTLHGASNNYLEKEKDVESIFKTRLHLDWADCLRANPEVICPICLYALPTSSISEKKKWQ